MLVSAAEAEGLTSELAAVGVVVAAIAAAGSAAEEAEAEVGQRAMPVLGGSMQKAGAADLVAVVMSPAALDCQTGCGCSSTLR